MPKIIYEYHDHVRNQSTYHTLQGDPARRMINRLKTGDLLAFTEERDIIIKELKL